MNKFLGSLLSLGVLSAAGVSLSLSNMSDDKSSYLLREATGDSKKKTDIDGKRFKDLSLVNHSYKDLLYGTKSYNNGNYLIYYGSEACPHCTGFLFGNQALSRGNLNIHRDKMSDGAWMNAYEFANTDPELKKMNIKFLMYEDEPEVSPYTVNDDLWTLPWSTWSETDLEKGRVKGEYMRNDESAIGFRKVMDAAIQAFGTKVAGTPTVIVYKDGIGKVFNQDELPGLEAAKQGEDLSNEIELKKYIKYYYTRVK